MTLSGFHFIKKFFFFFAEFFQKKNKVITEFKITFCFIKRKITTAGISCANIHYCILFLLNNKQTIFFKRKTVHFFFLTTLRNFFKFFSFLCVNDNKNIYEETTKNYLFFAYIICIRKIGN